MLNFWLGSFEEIFSSRDIIKKMRHCDLSPIRHASGHEKVLITIDNLDVIARNVILFFTFDVEVTDTCDARESFSSKAKCFNTHQRIILSQFASSVGMKTDYDIVFIHAKAIIYDSDGVNAGVD